MFTKTTRRALVSAVAALAATAALAPAAPAQDIAIAATPNCNGTVLQDGVGGVTIYVAGNPVRVPKVKDISFCVRVTGVTAYPDDTVRLNPFCGTPCFDVFSPASVSGASATAEVCFTSDGVRSCVGRTTTLPVSVSRPCLVSVGQPAQQPGSGCLVVIDRDTLLSGV